MKLALRFSMIAAAFVFGLSIFAPISTNALSGSDFKAGRIIDDVIFTNKDAMSVAQIQQFLNAKVPTCEINHSAYNTSNPPPYTCLKDYQENTTTGANNFGQFTGNTPVTIAGGKSAAQIIWEASQQYNINPQVMIILLQKEQGLVTDTWPLLSQFTKATGYLCPDTAACNSNAGGFGKQVFGAAWQFRNDFNGIDTPGFFSVYGKGQNNIRLNPNAACGTKSVYVENQATAVLYKYTPYTPNAAALNNLSGLGDGCSAYGNRNFWKYFTEWFGSTISSQPLGATLNVQISTGKIFLVTTDNNTRYYVNSWDQLVNYQVSNYGLIYRDDAFIQSTIDGGILTNLVWDVGGVFLVNSGKKYHFTSQSLCSSWGYDCSSPAQVKQLGTTFQSAYLLTNSAGLGDLTQCGSTFYQMSGGNRKPIADTQTLTSLGYSTQSALTSSSINCWQPLGSLIINANRIIKFSSGQVFFYDGSSYYLFENVDMLKAWGITSIFSPPSSSFDTLPPPSIDSITKWSQDGQGNKYLINSGKKYPLSSDQQSYWQGKTYQTFTSALLSALEPTQLSNKVASSGKIYTLASGKKHYVPTIDSIIGLGITNQNLTELDDQVMSSVPAGDDALSDGSLILAQDTQKIYVINGGKLAYINNPALFNVFGFSWSKIITYPSLAQLSSYPQDGSLVNFLTNIGNYGIPYSSSYLWLSPQMADDYGLIKTNFKPVAGLVTLKLTSGSKLSKFFVNTDTGKVYYASGGAIHYVASYQSYVVYGGLKQPLIQINNIILSNFVIAQDI